MISKEFGKQILEKAGFVFENTSGFGDAYKLKLENKWNVSAYCSFVGNPLAGDVDKSNYKTVDLHLHDCIGTSHICHSIESLSQNLLSIIKTLTDNSNNEEILKCPKCNDRYVRPKTPVAGQTWKPFLSCSGMQIIGKGKNKGVICSGISSKLPAVVNY